MNPRRLLALASIASVLAGGAHAQMTTRVSVGSGGTQANNNSLTPSISSSGRFVAFTSFAFNLVPGDTNDTSDIFVHDRDPDANGIFDEGNGTTIRVNTDATGAESENPWQAANPAISG